MLVKDGDQRGSCEHRSERQRRAHDEDDRKDVSRSDVEQKRGGAENGADAEPHRGAEAALPERSPGLRTPLAQIRMFGETLLLGRVRSDEERRRSLEIIDQEARRLTHLVENLLHFSRSERQTIW